MSTSTGGVSTAATDSSPSSDLLCLPNEVIDNVLGTLQLADMCNLRLCSRDLAAKTVQPRFKSFYHSKSIRLQLTALERFANVTRGSGLGCLVRNLTIVGQVENYGRVPSRGRHKARSQGDSVSADEELALLAVGFGNIAAAANGGRSILHLLKLAYSDGRAKIPGKGYKDSYTDTLRRWRPIWQCAATTCQTVLSALETSRLSTERLQLFNDFDLQRCSLACSALQTILDVVKPVLVLGTLTHLSLSISDAEDSAKLSGLRKVLEMCPRLEDLDLHQFSLGFKNLPETKLLSRRAISDERDPRDFSPSAQDNLTGLFRNAAEAHPMPGRLSHVRLDGFDTTGEDLLRFVRRAAPQHITLSHIRLAAGSFQPLFDYFTTPSSANIVVDLELRDLREGELSVIFDESDTQSLQREDGGVLLHPIAYQARTVYYQGGPDLRERMRRKRYVYGPL